MLGIQKGRGGVHTPPETLVFYGILEVHVHPQFVP